MMAANSSNSLALYTGEFERPQAMHLLRRAGFAPSAAEIEAALRDGLQATVERLVEPGADTSAHDELDEIGASLAARNDIRALRGWWLLRMCRTQRPLAARLALFWHNHFATSDAKVHNAALMLQQLRTFERLGLGRFDELLLQVARDPALQVWLDGDQNVKGRPNENFARELFELFSLGVGHYSETDIKQAARAFTGWRERAGRFYIDTAQHDGGTKQLFDQLGDFDGADVVRIACQQPACAPFIAEKLLREFVEPHPAADLIDDTARLLRESKFDVRMTLRQLLSSQAFFAPARRRQHIQSPVEFVVGLVRALHLKVPAETLAEVVSQMGQRPFEPPTVKGWEGQRTWLNSTTMIARLNAASQAVRNPAYGARGLAQRYQLSGRDACITFAVQLTLAETTPDVVLTALNELQGSDDEVLGQALELLLTAPEYQLA